MRLNIQRFLLKGAPVSENEVLEGRLGEMSDFDPKLAPGKARGKEGPRVLCNLMKAQQGCQVLLQPKLAVCGLCLPAWSCLSSPACSIID